MAIQRALLLIADIGGYTRFLKTHAINLAHAHDMVSQLLEAVIDGAASPLELAKLEGDAAFFYAPLSEDARVDVTPAVTAIRAAFERRKELLRIDRSCTCEGCTQVEQLTLKFVVHQGEVAFQRVKRFTELGGVDVIVVHRMLKNSVPIREYVLMTETLARQLAPGLREQALSLQEELEGLGRYTLRYVPLDVLEPAPALSLQPSALRRVVAWTRMTWRSLPYMLKLKQPCTGFRNFDMGSERVAGALQP
ncbi:hypothetical protein BO221_24190 [Archangium sp. Cb G35]|uniref:DUF2652 domain-containing protein n=1 Tax=Archangium sp. Cb G35 TaxID=1920190 RepID=UPI000937E9F0|nr:DUF2652 domain-containing protein [Archangium sp. Cb G35]OJT21866.1 hypothetical protein BO221_24190 [Archangium sp. Cb G35]